MPLKDFLYESAAGARYLNYTFGCPIADTVVDKLTIKVRAILAVNMFVFIIMSLLFKDLVNFLEASAIT